MKYKIIDMDSCCPENGSRIQWYRDIVMHNYVGGYRWRSVMSDEDLVFLATKHKWTEKYEI